MFGLIDIGANLTHSSFSADLGEVLARAKTRGVERIIVTGTSVEASRAAVHLAEQYPERLCATVGVHPHDAAGFCDDTLAQLRDLASHSCVCAIGETGLDFNRNYSPPDAQQRAFEAQLELAGEIGLPVFLHERDAFDRQIETLRIFRDQLARAVVHCFTGNRDMLHAYLELNLYIGITGWVCDERRGKALQEAVVDIPIERLMIETDAPYLLPRTLDASVLPDRRRNEPCTLPEVLTTLAAIRGEDPEVLARQTRANTLRFFNLPESQLAPQH